ncbi:MAG: cysteine--tRNA ligase [Oscillospiraceae bacterium]|nr:cysteine--tRNA ligase [Oscillospiraceae bacterium]
MVDIREQSPLSLAFVGDAVYSLSIREHFVKSKRYNINVLNKMTVKYVSAHGQFMALELIKDMLTEEESAWAKRGQNASKASVAKHASVAEYRASTGFECMLGYLKVTEQDERIEYIVSYILENLKFE